MAAMSRFPSTGPDGRPIDEEVAGLRLPADPTHGGWGFHPMVPCVSDPPSTAFRVRMVCMLLDTSGLYFGKGTLKQKLDTFLTYFQVCGCVRARCFACTHCLVAFVVCSGMRCRKHRWQWTSSSC